MKDKVFRGFIFAASVAMILIVYGTYTSDPNILIGSEASGLVAAAVGWLGFVRDLRRDAKTRQGNIS